MSESRGPAAPAPLTTESGFSFLAAELDDQVVLLDVGRAVLHLLDSGTARVWVACTGRSFDELRAVIPGSGRHLRQTLRELEASGLVRRAGETWVAAAARCV